MCDYEKPYFKFEPEMSKRPCTKRAFRDEIAAKLALSRIDKSASRGPRAKEPIRVYKCQHCYKWHMTSQPYLKREEINDRVS